MQYFLNNGKEQTGPLNFEDLTKIESKNDYYVWHKDLDDWELLSSYLTKDSNSNIAQENNEKISQTNDVIEQKVISKESGKDKKMTYLIVIAILVMGGVILALVVSQFTNQVSKLESSLSATSYVYPIVIKKLSFQKRIARTDGDPDSAQLSTDQNIFKMSEAMNFSEVISFLKVRSTDDFSFELKTKIFDPSGNLLHMPKSPQDFTISDSFYLTPDMPVASLINPPPVPARTLFSAFGADQSLSFFPGDYKVQIWFENKCLFEGGFTISNSLIANSLFKESGYFFVSSLRIK